MNVPPKRIDLLDKIALEAALAQLTPMQQEIMYMHYWLDLSLDHIGDELGPKYKNKHLTGSAIRYHLKHILEQMRKYLDMDD